jgi:hypothetical protein
MRPSGTSDGRTVELDEPFEATGSTMKLVTSAIYYAAAAQRPQSSHTTCRAR